MHDLDRGLDGAGGGPPDEPGEHDGAGGPDDLPLVRGQAGAEPGRLVSGGTRLRRGQGAPPGAPLPGYPAPPRPEVPRGGPPRIIARPRPGAGHPAPRPPTPAV